MSELYDSDLELGMLGTLRSELDDETDLDPIFFSMQLAHNAVINAYGDQKINSHATGMILKELKIKGSDGNYWTIGASTKSWYKRNNPETGAWELATEPEGVRLDGDPPYWYVKGVGSLINEISQIEKDRESEQGKEELVKESESFEQEPEELEWIFDEWDKGITVAEIEPIQTVVGNVGLPEEVPAAWNPDLEMFTNIESLESYPVGRSSDSVFDALDEQEIEFGLLDEQESKLDDEERNETGVDIDNIITKASKLEDYFMPYEETEAEGDGGPSISSSKGSGSAEKHLDSLSTPPTETTVLTPLSETDDNYSNTSPESYQATYSDAATKNNDDSLIETLAQENYEFTPDNHQESTPSNSSEDPSEPGGYIYEEDQGVEYDTDYIPKGPVPSFKAVPFTPGKVSSYIEEETEYDISDEESAVNTLEENDNL